MLVPVAVPAPAAVRSTAAGAGVGASCVEEVCAGPKKEVICCGACAAAAVKAAVEGAEVLAAAFCSACTFMLLGVSMRGVSPHTAAVVVCVICDAQGHVLSPR